MTLIETISAAITPAIEQSGCVLEEITFAPFEGSKLLSIIIDSETHLNLDQVTVVTKAISEIVDNLEVLDETPFTLEVSTPGLDRPLTAPRHWRKNISRLVSVTLTNDQKALGRIGEVSETGVQVGDSQIDFADIKHAMIEVEFKKVGE